MKHLIKISLITVVGLTVWFYVSHIRNMSHQTEQEYLAFLHSLRPDHVSSIAVYDEHNRLLKAISDLGARANFTDAVNAAERYEPNHPSYVKHFNLDLSMVQGPTRHLRLHTGSNDDGTIYIDLLFSKNSELFYGGSAKSRKLFDWIQSQGLLQ